MARTDNLRNYLTDIAQAIKDKKGDQTDIVASDFDIEIANLSSGGGSGEIQTVTVNVDVSEILDSSICYVTKEGRVNFTVESGVYEVPAHSAILVRSSFVQFNCLTDLEYEVLADGYFASAGNGGYFKATMGIGHFSNIEILKQMGVQPNEIKTV